MEAQVQRCGECRRLNINRGAFDFFPSFVVMNRCLLVLMLVLSIDTLSAQIESSITVNGQSRTFTYYDPIETGPKKLVFVLHGTTQTGAGIAEISLMHTLVDEQTIVCYPDGIGGAWSVGLFGGSTTDDVAFLDALIDLFLEQFNADPSRIYSCGFSAGGYLSYRMACESTHCMAAVASVAGVMVQSVANACVPPHGVPVMHFHGTSDFVVSYNGSALSGMSVNDVIAKWTNINGCNADAEITEMPDIDPADGCVVTKYAYTNCSDAHEVILFKIDGGGHMWPDTDVLLSGLGTIPRDINASQEIVQFFNVHECASGTGIAGQEAQLEVRLFPNPAADVVRFAGLQGRMKMRCIDAQGRLVEEFYVDSDGHFVVSDLPYGVYSIVPESGAPIKLVKH